MFRGEMKLAWPEDCKHAETKTIRNAVSVEMNQNVSATAEELRPYGCPGWPESILPPVEGGKGMVAARVEVAG